MVAGVGDMIRVVLVGLSATVLVAGCINRYCTAVACESVADICVSPTTDHWRVCRNELCNEYMGGTTVEEDLGFAPTSSSCVGVAPSGRLLQNGDVYTVTQWADDGAEVASFRWVATYEKRFPNGEECDGDYFCLYTRLDESNAE